MGRESMAEDANLRKMFDRFCEIYRRPRPWSGAARSWGR
jgi:hypothetical protein